MSRALRKSWHALVSYILQDSKETTLLFGHFSGGAGRQLHVIDISGIVGEGS